MWIKNEVVKKKGVEKKCSGQRETHEVVKIKNIEKTVPSENRTKKERKEQKHKGKNIAKKTTVK